MKTTSISSIKLGDALLLQFYKRTEMLFGKSIITPNMYMHCHPRQCLEDYGPLHMFWCFCFEQYNGVLGSMPNNNKAIEVQLTKRFLRDVQTSATQLPEELTEQFSELLSATITSVRAAQDGNTDFWGNISIKHNIRVQNFSHKETLGDEKEGTCLLK